MNIGRYAVDYELGEGGMGKVYAAHAPDGARVALKCLSHALHNDPYVQKRFQREAEIQQKLSHCPYICKCLEVFQHGDDIVLVLEFLDGEALDKHVARSRPSPAQIATWAEHVLTALSAAHSLDVIHRDVKPANIIITYTGNAVLTDFGVAHTRQSRLTQYGQAIGTRNYMSPEQWHGKVCMASDVYALGITLYEAITGSLPFGKLVNDYEIYRAVTDPNPFPSVRLAAPNTPPSLADFIDTCMAKDLRQRFPSAPHALQALQERTNTAPCAHVPQPSGTFMPLQDILRNITQFVKDVFTPGAHLPAQTPYARLLVYSRNHLHSEYHICTSEYVIGRDPQQCHLVINHDFVSRRHAIISRADDGTWWLQDISTNGTFLNGTLIGKNNTVRLSPGMRFSCCQTLPYEFALE